MLFRNKTALSAVCLLIAAAAFAPYGFGTNDFTEYWTAYRLLLQGANPYDPAQLLAAQRLLGWSEPLPIMMWNPPWTLLVLSPILWLDFHAAARALLACNLAFVALLLSIPASSRSEWRARGAVLLFSYPVWSVLQLGQLSLILSGIAVLTIRAARNHRHFLAGLLSSLLLVKPHLFLIFWLFFAVNCIRTREFGFIRGALIGTLTLAAATLLLFPMALGQWLDAVRALPGSSELVVAPVQWKTATLAYLVRAGAANWSGGSAEQLLPLFPALGMLLFLVLDRSARSTLSISERSAIALGFSVVFSPFAWIFDAAALIPLEIVALSRASREGRALLVFLNAAVFFCGLCVATEHQQLAAAPALLLIASLAVMLRKPGRSESRSAKQQSAKV